MTALIAPASAALGLVAVAVAGPRLLRAGAPMLMRIPRTAVTLLMSILLLWLLAVPALGLMLAWLVTGPDILPGSAAEVCQRCLDAANPFGSVATPSTAIPVVLLLVIPVAGVLTVGGFSALRLWRRRRATRSVADRIRTAARHDIVSGYRVTLVEDDTPRAFSLPRRFGGIVVTTGLRDTLESAELAAVLAHEHAHVRQRHHLIASAADAISHPLRWIPLVAAVADAVPHYLEIAADDAARRHAGTPALASALLRLGSPEPVTPVGATPSSKVASEPTILHAAGPDRIRHLVSPAGIRTSLLPVSTLSVQLAALATLAATVHGPYLYVLLTGCQPLT